MRAFLKLALTIAVVFGIFLLVHHGVNALHATVPTDMPRDASFAQSGYDIQHNEPRGNWIACRADIRQSTDFCRVTDAHGTVIYQGAFLPVNSSRPVAAAQLKVATVDEKRLWVRGPAEAAPVPVIPLTNGAILVPAGDAYALADRWNSNPDELRRIEGQ